MRKPTVSAMALFLAASLLQIGSSMAQDAPAANPTPVPAAKTPAAKGAQTPATKSGQATTAKKPGPAPLVLKTPKDKASYAIGMNIGKGLHKDSVDVDPAILLRGLKDGMAGGKTLLTDDEAKSAMAVSYTHLTLPTIYSV